MRLRNFALGAAAFGLSAAPATAEAARAAAPVEHGSQLAGNSDVFYVLGAAAAVAAILLLVSDDDDEPISGWPRNGSSHSGNAL